MTIATLTGRAAAHKTISFGFIKLPWKLMYFSMALVSLVMLVLYVQRVNELTQGAYTIKNDNKEIAALMAQNRDLGTTFAESSFLGQAQQEANQLSFEKITNVKYMQILQSPLAQAR